MIRMNRNILRTCMDAFRCFRRDDADAVEVAVVGQKENPNEAIQQKVISDFLKAVESRNMAEVKRIGTIPGFNAAKAREHGSGRMALHFLNEYDNQEDIMLFFNQLYALGCKPNDIDKKGNTPLKLAAESGKERFVKLLLNNGADVELKDKFGEDSPLHCATKKDNFNIVKMLLVEGATTNVQNKNDETPLHLAVGNKSQRTVELLMWYKADAHLKNKSNQSSIDIAKNHKEILDIVKKNPRAVRTADQQLIDINACDVVSDGGVHVLVSGEHSRAIQPHNAISHFPNPTDSRNTNMNVTNVYNVYNVTVEDGGSAAVGENALVHQQVNSPNGSSPPFPIGTAGRVQSPVSLLPSAPIEPERSGFEADPFDGASAPPAGIPGPPDQVTWT